MVEVTRGWLGRQVVRRYNIRRKTRAITVLVQEVYLRDDIACGSTFCRSCVQDSPPLLADTSHYLIPDADVLVQFLEIWELPQITSVIYLASVVKEVLVRSNQRNARRLRSLFTDRRRQCLFFDDEHFVYTWSLQKDACQGNAEQFGKRVEAVGAWFYDHLQGSVPIIVLQLQCELASLAESNVVLDQLKTLSISDAAVRNVRRLEVLNIDTYLKEFWHHDPSVLDLYSSLVQSLAVEAQMAKEAQHPEFGGRKRRKDAIGYKEHLPGHLIEADAATGALFVGVFHVNKRNPLEGYVHPSNKGGASQLSISVPGRLLQNRALPGDLVGVRIFDQKYWVAAKQNLSEGEVPDVADYPNGSSKLSDLDVGEETLDLIGQSVEGVDVQEDKNRESLPTGEIVGILQRFQRDYVACLAEDDEDSIPQSSSSRREHLLCIPMDRRVPMVRVATRLADRLVGQRFVIRIDGWEQDSRTPRGHFVRLLGPIGDLNAETLTLLVENGINTLPFSYAAMEDLPEDSTENPWIIPNKEFANRRDLRFSHRTYSIDPPGSKDVDDALSVNRLSNNFLEIGVHIADVSYFIRQDSLLDLEARARGTTVYMVGKNWPMLPEILSENLCSLNGGKDRLAVSVIWTVDPENDFEIVDVWFGRTVIHSRHQMFYAQAQAILDGQNLPIGWELAGGLDEVAAVESDLVILADFAQMRQDLRKAHGALELTSSEFRFETAADREPVSVDTNLELPMNWIVAELMILANYYVAMKIYQAFPSKALLRRHDPPRLDNFKLLLECCSARGFTLDTSSNKTLANSLDRMRDSNDPVVENAFRALATRAMSEAEYCSTGEVTDPSGLYHYGLALRFYTHFTSPIRRYADVLVHRMLMASCEHSPRLEKNSDAPPHSRISFDFVLPGMDLKEVVDHLNERHRASKKAQKECNDLYLLMYLQKHSEAEHAVIISIQAKGMMVFVPKYDIRASVFCQGKKGHIILPAEDNSMLNDTEESLVPKETLLLVKEAGSMKITETGTGKVLAEYKLMDTVWVQLRADGSRAHAPKLRVRLLSPSHPAAKASALLEGSRRQTRYLVRKGAIKRQSGQSKGVARKLTKSKVVSDMVEIVAVEEALEDSLAKLNVPSKRKAQSIHDVTDNFKRLKASSVYLDVIRYCSVLEGLLYSGVPEMCGKETYSCEHDDYVRWTPLTLGMKHAKEAVQPEQQLVVGVQRLWRNKLSHAARVRALRLWSSQSEEGPKQMHWKQKENHLRSRANLLGMWLVDSKYPK